MIQVCVHFAVEPFRRAAIILVFRYLLLYVQSKLYFWID
nr:MAG TPA: hypothetical protein [Caudoviricetes sp.]